MADNHTNEVVEIWKPVPGLPLFVSDMGNVRRASGKIAALMRAGKGGKYRCVNSGTKRIYVHRIVLEAFVGPAKGRWALHRNDVPTDNRLVNLYWGTGSDNWRDAVRNGNPMGTTKLNDDQVRAIRARYKPGIGGNGATLRKEFGIGCAQLSRIITREDWKHV